MKDLAWWECRMLLSRMKVGKPSRLCDYREFCKRVII
jgi:hypothetical protein